MLFYGIVPSRVTRILRFPHRNVEGIAENTFACMQQVGTQKNPSELWVMYQVKQKKEIDLMKKEFNNSDISILSKLGDEELENINKLKPQIVVISTWKYPGISPVKEEIPMPSDIKKVFGL